MALLYLYVFDDPESPGEDYYVYAFSQKHAERKMRKWYPRHEPKFRRRERW